MAYRISRQTIGEVAAGFQENVDGVRVVQAFAREEVNQESFDRLNDENRQANIQANTLSSGLMPVIEFSNALATVAVIWYGGSLVMADAPLDYFDALELGARSATADLVLFLSPDVLPSGRGWLVGGLLLLAAGGYAVTRRPRLLGAAELVAGATGVAVAATRVDDHVWVGVLVGVATVGGALGAIRVDRAGARFGTGPLLVAITAAGVYVCVPDTEQAIPLMAGALGLVVVALWPRVM